MDFKDDDVKERESTDLQKSKMEDSTDSLVQQIVANCLPATDRAVPAKTDCRPPPSRRYGPSEIRNWQSPVHTAKPVLCGLS